VLGSLKKSLALASFPDIFWPPYSPLNGHTAAKIVATGVIHPTIEGDDETRFNEIISLVD
jgi:hypothetical protein